MFFFLHSINVFTCVFWNFIIVRSIYFNQFGQIKQFHLNMTSMIIDFYFDVFNKSSHPIEPLMEDQIINNVYNTPICSTTHNARLKKMCARKRFIICYKCVIDFLLTRFWLMIGYIGIEQTKKVYILCVYTMALTFSFMSKAKIIWSFAINMHAQYALQKHRYIYLIYFIIWFENVVLHTIFLFRYVSTSTLSSII